MFFKLLWYDFRVGLLQKYRKFLVAAAVFAGACVEHLVRLSVYQRDPLYPVADTLGNTLLSVIGGMQEYSPTVDKQFTFPVVWLMLYLLPAYFTLHYPQQDLTESGQNLLIRTRGRNLWWISKCLWNTAFVLVFWSACYLVAVLFCAFRGIPLSLGISENIGYFLDLRFTQLWQYPEELNLELLLLPFLVSAALCLLQMAVSLFLKPVFSFMIIGALLLVSAYYQSPYILGNYAMPVRSSGMITGGMDPVRGVLFSLGLATTSFLVGLVRFRYYDILKRE